jgi:hypothetical protein
MQFCRVCGSFHVSESEPSWEKVMISQDMVRYTCSKRIRSPPAHHDKSHTLSRASTDCTQLTTHRVTCGQQHNNPEHVISDQQRHRYVPPPVLRNI